MLFLDMLQTGNSWTFRVMGRRKVVCAVLPPFRRVAAMPELAVARAIPPCNLTLAKIKLMRNVFPVPPK